MSPRIRVQHFIHSIDLLIFTLVLGFSPVSFAGPKDTNFFKDVFNGPGYTNHGNNSGMVREKLATPPAHNPEYDETVTSPSPPFPGFPRSFYEHGTRQTIVGSFEVAMRATAEALGLGVGFGFRHELRWSLFQKAFMVMQTANPVMVLDKNGVEIAARQQMYYWDPVTRRALIQEKPIGDVIGFCSYSAQAAWVSTQGGRISYIFPPGPIGMEVSGGVELQQERYFAAETFSDTFVVPFDNSIQQVHANKCAEFRQQMEDSINADLALQLREYLVHYHPDSNCQPDPELDNANGDDSCKEWFNKYYGTTYGDFLSAMGLRKKALADKVPRCVENLDGNLKCELRARENASCRPRPKLKDAEREKFAYLTRLKRQPLCDERANLYCGRDRENESYGADWLPGLRSYKCVPAGPRSAHSLADCASPHRGDKRNCKRDREDVVTRGKGLGATGKTNFQGGQGKGKQSRLQAYDH